jgi:hypothetical protein
MLAPAGFILALLATRLEAGALARLDPPGTAPPRALFPTRLRLAGVAVGVLSILAFAAAWRAPIPWATLGMAIPLVPGALVTAALLCGRMLHAWGRRDAFVLAPIVAVLAFQLPSLVAAWGFRTGPVLATVVTATLWGSGPYGAFAGALCLVLAVEWLVRRQRGLGSADGPRSRAVWTAVALASLVAVLLAVGRGVGRLAPPEVPSAAGAVACGASITPMSGEYHSLADPLPPERPLTLRCRTDAGEPVELRSAAGGIFLYGAPACSPSPAWPRDIQVCSWDLAGKAGAEGTIEVWKRGARIDALTLRFGG